MNRAERRRKARELREVPQSAIEMGEFEAPCGSTIMYVNDMTDMDPSAVKVIHGMAMADRMKAIRKMAVADHLRKGDCPVPEICANALAADAL